MREPAVVLKPRDGVRWRPAFVIGAAIATIIYLSYARDAFPHGGSPVGLVYGVIGFLSIVLLAFFGIRKRRYQSSFGTLEQWLQFHLYLGLFALVVLLLHSGLRFHDRVAAATLVLVCIVVVSGIVGALLYATIPRVMTDAGCNLPAAKVSAEINDLAKSMAEIAAGRSPAFARVFDALLNNSALRPLAGWRLLMSRAQLHRMEMRHDLRPLIAAVAADEQDELRRMLIVARQRHELLLRLMMQQRYKNLLEAWLYVHVPFTFALIVLAIMHVASVFYFGAVRW